MQRRALVLVPLVAAAAALTFSASAPRCDAGGNHTGHWDRKTHVAHEWGMFTSVQGADGVVLEGLRHEERDLPSFVHDLRESVGVTGVSPKMETPVIYFYSPDDRRVNVRVGFPHGVITQWYPAASIANHVGPLYAGQPTEPNGDVIEDLSDGFIRWGQWQDLLVMGRDADQKVLPVADDDPWRFSRQVDANLLRTCNHNLALRKIAPKTRVTEMSFEYERMLFYRGLGDFALPLQGRVTREDVEIDRALVRIEFTNTRPEEPIEHVFVVHVEDGRAGFEYLPRIVGEAVVAADIERLPLATSTEVLVRQLAEKLTATGLYEDEALAMARTWQEGYFNDEGLRVLYVLPRALIDRELPLTVRDVSRDGKRPAEFEVVRTFVGRTELLSPSRESRMERAVQDFALGNELERASAERTLDSWGRFAIPYLSRIAAMTSDDSVRTSAKDRLDALALRR